MFLKLSTSFKVKEYKLKKTLNCVEDYLKKNTDYTHLYCINV